MDIIQNFYNKLASDYEKLFLDWDKSTEEQAEILNKIFINYGYDCSYEILDCACGIGTQAIGLAAIGYNVTALDISECAIEEAKQRASKKDVYISFVKSDFRELDKSIKKKFKIIIAIDNALPHMLTKKDLTKAVNSITNQLDIDGIFVASIRDYDSLLIDKPPFSSPYIHKTDKGQRVSFQTWDWKGDNYKLVQYIIQDENEVNINKYECEYRAVKREELTDLFLTAGCCNVEWKFPEETGFYQPILIVKK